MKKLGIGSLVAVVLATILVVRTNWNPLCVLYDPGDWMYEFMDCGHGAPPKDPTT